MQAFADVADRLFELVIHLDPARTTWERIQRSARDKCRALEHAIESLREYLRHQSSAALEESVRRSVRDALESLASDLAELKEALSQSAGAMKWRQLYASLARNYDGLTKTLASLDELRADVRFRRLTPSNYVRNVFHVASGVAGALIYHYLLTQAQAAIIMAICVATFTFLEILRRQSATANDALMRLPFFKRIARAREYYQVNSSTYYAWGMLIAVLLFPRQAVEAACVVLAVGDPIASNLGRRFGRIKIHKDKSLVAFQRAVYPAQPIGWSIAVAAAGAVAGATAEALTTRFDDNLTVPLAVACALSFLVA
jgi:dolichol kinase